MVYSTFSDLLSIAEASYDFQEFSEKIPYYSEYLEQYLWPIWHYAHDRSITCLRGFTRMSRVQFSGRYQLPYRTVTDWEHGLRVPPPYVLDLIAFAVITDRLY